MKRRFTDEQIICILKEHEAGITAKDLCRKHGMSDATFYKWKAKFSGLEVNEARRLHVLLRREGFGENSTILEYDGGLVRNEAEQQARGMVFDK